MLEFKELTDKLLFNLNRSIVVGKSKSGKTYLMCDLLFKNLLKQSLDSKINILEIIFFSGSFLSSNHIYKLIIIYNLYISGYNIKDIPEKFVKCISNFKFKDIVTNETRTFISKGFGFKYIKNVLNEFIIKFIKELEKYGINKDNDLKNKFISANFYFIDDTKDMKLSLDRIEKDKFISTEREILLILDDISSDKYKDIKSQVATIFEQGRHHDCGIIVIDQYFKSEKLNPISRQNANNILMRSFDDGISKFIQETFGKTKKDINTEQIAQLLADGFCIIYIDSIMDTLFYYKSPSNLKDLYKIPDF